MLIVTFYTLSRCRYYTSPNLYCLNIHVHGELNSIQHYVIKFVSDLQQVGGFLRVLRFPPPIKQNATIKLTIVEIGGKHHNPNPEIYLPVCIPTRIFMCSSFLCGILSCLIDDKRSIPIVAISSACCKI